LKFTIQQDDLQKALAIVANVVANKPVMPVLNCVLLEVDKGRLTVSSSNLDMSVTTSTDKVAIKDGGRLAVPAAKFISFVRSLPAGEVVVSEKGGRVSVVAGKSSLSEQVMDVAMFPSLPGMPEGEGHEVDAGVLARMVRATSYAVSRDETRPALLGILWELKPTSLAMVATDAHRLTRIERKMDWTVTEVRSVIADTPGLLQFVRLAEGVGTARVKFGDNQISFRLGETVLHIRLLEGPFPDYTAVIPQANNLQMIVDREALNTAARRVSITADRVTSQIRLGVEAGRLELSASGTDGSRTEDEMPVQFDGEAMEIGFNYAYLLDVLKNVGADTLRFSLRDSQSAALVRPEGDSPDGDLLCLLMPLRLTSE
jgi:DNA polymerase-3 subunit beta